MKKYELTDGILNYKGRKLHRIIALRDFDDISEGNYGGWIEQESNLSHDGNCWVYYNGIVMDNARVIEDAKVLGLAEICDEAIIRGIARVSGQSEISGNTELDGTLDCSNNDLINGNFNLNKNIL